jgi:hypothetical protein
MNVSVKAIEKKQMWLLTCVECKKEQVLPIEDYTLYAAAEAFDFLDWDTRTGRPVCHDCRTTANRDRILA